MLRAILIDDEPECLKGLVHEIKTYCPAIEVIGQYGNGKEAIKAIHRDEPDILFLDIDMPFINGFDLLEMVPDVDFEVIFTTAHDEYAIRAFRISAIDYLLKPIEPEDLKAAVDKVRAVRESGNSARQIQFLLQQIKDLDSKDVKRIAFPTFDGMVFVNLDDIVYCRSDGAYSYIYFEDGTKLHTSKNLRFLESALCQFHFYRVHNSYIINIHHVRKYSKKIGGKIIMSNGDEVSVSRSKKNELFDLF